MTSLWQPIDINNYVMLSSKKYEGNISESNSYKTDIINY